MRKVRLPGGLRARLAIVISLVTLGVLVTTYIAVHQESGSAIEHRINDEVREQQHSESEENSEEQEDHNFAIIEKSVEETQSSLRKTFVITGAVTLAVAILLGVWLATLITKPLRKMARFASSVEAGDLTQRIGHIGSGDEVTVLADSFDRMLERLELAFSKQRDFVSDASHELRTPLTVLRGQIEVLQKVGDDPKERERTITTVLGELDRMNRLVDDMLLLAKLQDDRFIAPRPTNLRDFMADLERDLPFLGDRQYIVETVPEIDIALDPERVQQVLRNLISNAVAHTEAGDRIEIAICQRENHVEFAVSDSGPGISQAELTKIFDRFHRTDQSRTRASGGSGLGLAIAKAVVEAMGGKIWAQSSQGQGATFRFTIPLRQVS